MKKINCLLWLWLLLLCPAGAQDVMPALARTDRPMETADSVRRYGYLADPVTLTDYPLPENFRNVQENVISDPHRQLSPFWQKLVEVSRADRDSVRIVHVGDSHVRGHIFPLSARDVLQEAFGRISYVDDGINGATNLTFTMGERVKRISLMQPDMLILSFGTNESHGRGYNETRHYSQMADLLRMLRESMPDVPILLTTPPGSYERGGTRRQRSYTVNPRTQIAVRNILKFADEHELAVWNLYDIFGGADYACRNWTGAGLMRPDHVHYMPEGYLLQGQWLSQAILKAYNAYVEPN